MQTHRDSDFLREPEFAKRFMRDLEERADKAKAAGTGKITVGADGEPILADYETGGVHIRKMPDDPQGILRISIGGGEDLPVTLNYCTYRGSRFACIELLEKVLAALKGSPSAAN